MQSAYIEISSFTGHKKCKIVHDLKAVVGDKIFMWLKHPPPFYRTESIVEKGDDADKQHFLLLAQYF